MKNIFPIADKAFIEETVGINRPSAQPPKEQGVKECSFQRKKAAVIPQKPKWFLLNELSFKEKMMLENLSKNYFKDRKESDKELTKELTKEMEEEYLNIRNSIINNYEDSQQYIPLTFVTKTSNYRLATVAFNFLEDNKIINNNIEMLEIIDSFNEILVNMDIPNADLEKFEAMHEVFSKEREEKKTEEICENTDFYTSKESRRVKEKYFKKEMLENAKCSCNSTANYFNSDLLFICENCYVKKAFPSKYSIKNFHKLSPDLLNSIWTKQEEYILLKNIEMYGDSWNKVSEGLNKSFEQCIFHFIKMSIIDSVSHFPPIPFTQVPNPVSTFIAFVCSLVYPSIATDLSKKALQQINNPKVMEVLLNTAKAKAYEVLALEKLKIKKLEKVEIEALIKQVMLKVDAVNEMHAEIQAVKSELEDERERLLDEFTRIR